VVDRIAMGNTNAVGDERTPPPLGFHVTMRLREDRVLARGADEVGLLARLLLRHGAKRGLLAFGVADTHLHAVLECTRSEAGAFAQVVQTAIRRCAKLEVPFDRARFRAVRDVWHLRNTVRYVTQQEARHGLVDDLAEGTVAPDVLGLRVVEPQVALRVRRSLPRVGREEWLAWVGWEDWRTAPMLLEALRDAAAASVGGARLGSRGVRSRAARVAACHLARGAGLASGHIASLLGISVRAVFQALKHEPDADVLHAIEGQLRLRGRRGVRVLRAAPEREAVAGGALRPER
jgi:hypothetical protein